MSSRLTQSPGDIARWQVIPGMAHFAGTGPRDKVCGSCVSYMRGDDGSDVLRCLKFKQITGAWGRGISSGNPACKYFVEKLKPRER